MLRRKTYRILWWIGIVLACVSIASCRGNRMEAAVRAVDSLNHRAYEWRYKDLDISERAAKEAFLRAEDYPSGRAQALNHWGFCRFMRMDFEQADSLFREVYPQTSNELEYLVADIGRMKICQRTAQNKEFYDHRNRAMRRIRQIRNDEEARTDAAIRQRLLYAESEFSITSSIYYYYLQQERQSVDAIHEVDVESLEKDMGQWLYYAYMKGSGGLCEGDNPEEIRVEEFDYLMDCLTLSREQGYVYFEANALQALAEMLMNKDNYRSLERKRPGMMRVINQRDIPQEELAVKLAERALDLFTEYGDGYQIAASYRTLASCYAETGQYEQSLAYLTEALECVNRHHEQYYHCTDTADRLRPYIPMATNSIELEWINQDGIMTVPEWIARFREQLSVTYAALGLKPQSDYNRNIYLDILDYTRQDKELESRYAALQTETMQLNVLLTLVIVLFISFGFLFAMLNRRWRVRNALYIDKLKTTLDICRKITTSVPSDAEDGADVVAAVWKEVKDKLLALVGASDMEVVEAEEEAGKTGEGFCVSMPLEASDHRPLGEWRVYAVHPLKKEDRALLQIIAPYLSWTLENGLGLISLDDECRRLEKEKYVHEQHLVENKRQNVIKKACFFIVTGIMPYIDRVMNEVHKLIALNYLSDGAIKESKFRYIDELVSCINEYNDVLAIWIKMRQGSLSLNVENFELEPLFEVLRKRRKSFENKEQQLTVSPTASVVKADRALTLFMINTLTENARKYTQRGGEIQVYASEAEEYVEISVQDNGPGLSAEDVQHILGEKVYDSGQIGLQTAVDVEALQKNKGSGFGLMNCKGIMEKYRKTNALFHVCGFFIESRIGEGSRFYFRLPKGVRRMMGMWLMLCLPFGYGCTDRGVAGEGEPAAWMEADSLATDVWIEEANRMANKVYHANLSGAYQDALLYADSALVALNGHYRQYSGNTLPQLTLTGEGDAAELEWFADRFYTDYYTLLDVRNEVAVACLALGLFDTYQYNNQAYTSLYKQISVDTSLEQYCEQMQQSANDKMISIVLCFVLLGVLLFGYYMFYFRHRLMYRYNLEQVFAVNERAFRMPLFGMREGQEIASTLASGLYAEMNELVSMEALGIAVFNEETNRLCTAFSSSEEQAEDMTEDMRQCFRSGHPSWNREKKIRCLPLCVHWGEETHRMGVLAFRSVYETEREEDGLLLELVADYVSNLVYHAVKRVAGKYRDIEEGQDEVRRVMREESQLHVQNLVFDNCLSTIKHETVYYPHKIKQIIDRLQQGLPEAEERQQVESIADLISYYKEVFTTLSAWAARQLEEVTFRRSVVAARMLAEHAVRYHRKLVRKLRLDVHLQVEAEEVRIAGDWVLLKFLLENLLDEAMSCPQAGELKLSIVREGDFVRFNFIDRRRQYTQEELNQLFYPHLSRMERGEQDILTGTEYLICKQIIRDHDEFSGRRGCRMNAEPLPDGGYMVWCTVPAHS